jgi:DNA-binding NtrC family response regulator
MTSSNVDSEAVRLLVVDDDEQVLQFIAQALSKEKLILFTASDKDSALELVAARRPDIVLLDLVLPGVEGMELLDQILEIAPGTDIILMTGAYSTDSAVEAIHRGACDYLAKPFSAEKLRERLSKLIVEAGERKHTQQLDRELIEAFKFQGIVGRSPLVLEVLHKIRRIAPHFRTALISGATGTGKELAARALHHLCPAAHRPMAVCNCSAIVETLFESELFGHVRGSFTGATQNKVGLFEYADGSTVLLDEIGDMPLTTQAKLLRVIQYQEVQPVGSPVARKIDVRVIAATHQKLAGMVKEGRFREDLYYRLSMVEIELPRLADRKEDLPLLERHFVEQFARQFNKPIRGISRRAQALLARYSWPGNVRELENVLGNACMLGQGNLIDVNDLPERLRALSALRLEGDEDELLPLEEVEARHIRRVLEKVGGNKLRAAEILGISRATLYRALATRPGKDDPVTLPAEPS